MVSKTFHIVFFSIIFALLAFLIYAIQRRPSKVLVYNENVPDTVHSEWWGYGWRPYWRRFNGVPGFGPGTPLPNPKMPVAPKPIVIDTKKTQ